jgi:hypothetical protein
VLKWDGSEEQHGEFIEKIARVRESASEEGNKRRIKLVIDDNFLFNMFELGEQDADEVFQALAATPIKVVHLDVLFFWYDEDDEPAFLAYIRLWQTLGAIESATDIRLCSDQWKLMAPALTHMSLHATMITVGRKDDEDPAIYQANLTSVCHELIRRSQSLHLLELVVDNTILSTLLPVLAEMPVLSTVYLIDKSYLTDIIDQVNTQAMAHFLSNMLRASVRLENFSFPETALWTPFHVRQIRISNCSMGDPVSFARALAVQRIRKIEVKLLAYSESCMTSFCNELANRLDSMSMPVLTEVSIKFTNDSEQPSFGQDLDAAQNRLIRSLSNCGNLETLSLRNVQWTPSTKQALEACVRGLPNLTDLHMYTTEEEPKDPFTVPALQEVLKDNFVIQSMTLLYYCSVSSHFKSVPGLDTVPCLNREGRSYMREDKLDRSKGINLLARVNTSLDCLYFHLRENPSLIYEHGTKRYGNIPKQDSDACCCIS